MGLIARDIMRTDIESVGPDMTLPELERAFLSKKVGAFPVSEGSELLGIVSRSDVVRQLCVEQSRAESLSMALDEGVEDPQSHAGAIGRQVGERFEKLRVRDVLIHDPVKIDSSQALDQIASKMTEEHVHSLLVVDDGKLVGILTSLDLVRLIADGRV